MKKIKWYKSAHRGQVELGLHAGLIWILSERFTGTSITYIAFMSIESIIFKLAKSPLRSNFFNLCFELYNVRTVCTTCTTLN